MRGFPRAVEVAARVVREQVEDRGEVEVGQRLGPFRADPVERGDGGAGELAEQAGHDGRLLDAEEVRVERLAAVVHLGGGAGAVVAEPLGDPSGGRGRRAFALDDRDDLVVRR